MEACARPQGASSPITQLVVGRLCAEHTKGSNFLLNLQKAVLFKTTLASEGTLSG
jgi:hypothetical protein